MTLIQATGLTKTYRTTNAVKGIDFTIEAGGCVGLLGPNGAGKTTTMKMLVGQTTITDGELTLFDVPVSKLSADERGRLGLVSQDNNLDPDLTVEQNLQLYGRYYGLSRDEVAPRVEALLDFVQLKEKRNDSVRALSGGMQRRLVIARALIADPELVILDEPTTGLDPQARVLIWQRVLELKKQGKTLLLTTHYMDEAQRLCDRIIVIDGGEILDDGTPKELIKRHVPTQVYEVNKPLPKALEDDLSSFEADDLGDSVQVYVNDPKQLFEKLDHPETQVRLHRPANLEDVFLRLTGRNLREGA